MREGYCSHPVCLCVCLSVCLSVTALALTYDACATKLAYQCILRCTQKVLNWAFSLKSLLSRVPACFLFALPNRRPFCNIEVATWTLTTITSNCQCLTTAFSEFDDHYPMQRPLPREANIPTVHCIYAASWRFELEYLECEYSNESTSWSWLTGVQLECDYSNQSTSWSWLNRICVGVRAPRVRELVHCECVFNASSFALE